jgi:predicted DNA-binding transcriptional regulator AlpA
MKTVDPERLPLLLRVSEAVAISGLSRAELYRRLGDGALKGKKMRSARFIMSQSLLDLIASLPDN